MSGPTHPWDQPEDPRESTINLPRIVDGAQDSPAPPARPRSDRTSWQGRTIRRPAEPQDGGQAPAGRPGGPRDDREPAPGGNGDTGLYRMRPAAGDRSSGFFDPSARSGQELNGSAAPTASSRAPGRGADQFSAWQPPANGAGLDQGTAARPQAGGADGQPNGSRAGNGHAATRWPAADRPALGTDEPGTRQPAGPDRAAAPREDDGQGAATAVELAPSAEAQAAAVPQAEAQAAAVPQAEEPAEPPSRPAGPAHAEHEPDQPAAGRQDAQAQAGQQADAAQQVLPDYLTVAPDQLQRPARGSLADLQRRLLRLPDGHPSSHFEDGGARKPAPPRIRHYELPLTEDEREAEPVPAGRGNGSSAEIVTRSAGEPRPAPGSRSLPEDGSVANASVADVAGLATAGALTPEQERVADRVLAACRTAEGRREAGGYGQSGLTPAIRRVAEQLSYGRLVPDSEQQVIKSPDRFRLQLARLIARHPDTPVGQLAAEIGDTIRYAFVFEPADYTEGTWQVHRRLSAGGFELEARRNRWESPESKGIRSRWRDPAHDVSFEVQFHTPASWEVQQQTFAAYLQITDPATAAAERAALRARQVAAAAAAKPPPGWTEIADFRADNR